MLLGPRLTESRVVVSPDLGEIIAHIERAAVLGTDCSAPLAAGIFSPHLLHSKPMIFAMKDCLEKPRSVTPVGICAPRATIGCYNPRSSCNE